ncbi:MAG: EI24 domain-containing protein, partial [Epsilonproteobacteria bacterium]|nr:EI24 domain-containing protein [Campylobacterota bacterium]
PVVNIIAFNIPFFYLFHKMMHYDIASNILTREEAKQIGYFNKNEMRLKSLALYILSLIPFTVFFTAVFFVIYLGHTYFEKAEALRARA